MSDLTITVPARYAGYISAWDKRYGYRELLKGGIDNASQELRGVATEDGGVDGVRAVAEAVQWYVDELLAIAAEDVQNRLGELRKAAGMEVQEIADRLGVEPSMVHKWELDERVIPSKHWKPLAEMFGVSIAWLVNRESNNATLTAIQGGK